MIDPRSAKNIGTLLLKVQPVFTQCLLELKKHFAQQGVDARYISGTRTYAEQAEIYAQGRTKPGPIVTRSKPGFSNHNFSIAVDVGLFKGTKYLDESPLYKEIGPIVAKFPDLEWGGSWKSIIDEPHIQYRTGLTLAQMRERVAAGKSIV